MNFRCLYTIQSAYFVTAAQTDREIIPDYPGEPTESQGSLQEGGRGREQRRGVAMEVRGWSDVKKGPEPGRRWRLEAGKGKETDPVLKPPEGTWPC